MSDLVQPFLLYIGCALGALGVILAMPRRGANPQVLGGVLAGAAVGAIFLALGLGVARHAGINRLPNINFYVFSIIAIGAALRVISHQRPVYAALYFILTILASCGLYVVLAAEFMAFALVIVYAGAILITYLFVIMLATEAPTEEQEEQLQAYDRYSREPVAATVAAFILLATLTTLMARGSQNLPGPGVVNASVAKVQFRPGVEESVEEARRPEPPSAVITVMSDRAAAGRLNLAVAGRVLDLDAQSMETGLPVSLAPGENLVGVTLAKISDLEGRNLDAWFTAQPIGDASLLSQLPGRVQSALSEARDPADPSKSLLRSGEKVVAVDVERKLATVATASSSGVAGGGERRVVPFPADIEIYNVEGVAFTLLNKHPGAIEIAGIILLMAMLGAVVLARKKVEMDDAAKLAAQQRHLVTVVEAGPIVGRDRMNSVTPSSAAPSTTGGRA